MGRIRAGFTTLVLTAALIIVAAGPALAHGDDHDISRIAAGAIDGTQVTIWAGDAPTADGLSVTVGIDADDGAHEVTIVATDPGGVGTLVEAQPAGPDHWEALVPVTEDGPTVIEVRVALERTTGHLRFEYSAPAATLWMKLIISAAFAHGAASAWWLWSRRNRAFRRALTSIPAPVAG